MKTEITPKSWLRFGNVINTSEKISIYCIELSSFPETHMLTKFKCNSFSEFPKTIQNIGLKYEKVISFSRKSGSVSRVETENYIVYLNEDNRVMIKDDVFIDNSLINPDVNECYDFQKPLRSEYSDMYKYLNSKKVIPCPNDCWCGDCYWTSISIHSESIPECTLCKQDTLKVEIKAHTKNVEIEPNCCSSCIWWDWFHNIRKNILGCKCIGVCDCGKLKYKKKDRQPPHQPESVKKMNNKLRIT